MYEYGMYVYGIIDNVDEDMIREIKGIDNLHNLYSIKEDDFYIMASDVDLKEYGEGELDKRLEDMVWVEEKARKHFDTIQALLKFGTVIPMKFCTIFTCRETMLQFIEKYREKIKEAISLLKGKEEWDVKVYCDKKKFIECNMEEEKEMMKNQIKGVSKGAAYFLTKKAESGLEEKAKEKIIRIKDEFWNDLKVNAEQTKINKNLSKQVTEYADDMIINGAFLIRKEEKSAFMDAINNQEETLKRFNMEVKVSGPWPFYNFSSLFFT